ncbi:hypothetical protein E1301_Tti019576 [Triplophysa tibetana]|uniref:Uncharacterized protein n=1 Tax=Triplophysa tibetana TaxID=1572043 RepID=A0A5A9P458_9TELE|nr:hypothetical protein E1301_Tti019576 [Triplophysa tibetana]
MTRNVTKQVAKVMTVKHNTRLNHGPSGCVFQMLSECESRSGKTRYKAKRTHDSKSGLVKEHCSIQCVRDGINSPHGARIRGCPGMRRTPPPPPPPHTQPVLGRLDRALHQISVCQRRYRLCFCVMIDAFILDGRICFIFKHAFSRDED